MAAVAPVARYVFAVDPVAALRRDLERAVMAQRFDNLFVLDGRLSLVPLPEATADVLFTRNAIGWQTTDELEEINRVVKPDGWAAHFPEGPQVPANVARVLDAED